MWNYNYTRPDDYLQHAGERKNHKYLDRIKSGKGWRYFYRQDEIDAYKKALSSKDEQKSLLRVTGTDKLTRTTFNTGTGKMTEKPLSDKDKVANAKIRAWQMRSNANKTQKQTDIAKAKQATRAESNYDKATTAKGKVGDLKKAFNKYHPSTVKKISEGKKAISKFLKTPIKKTTKTSGTVVDAHMNGKKVN